MQVVQLPGGHRQGIAFQDDEVGAQARRQATHFGLIEACVRRVAGETAQRFGGAQLLFRQPATGRLPLAILAGDGGVETKARVGRLDRKI